MEAESEAMEIQVKKKDGSWTDSPMNKVRRGFRE